MHDGDAEQPRRENDCRLMDRGVSIKHKRAINRHLNEFRWMSDVRDETGTAWNEAAQAVTDTESEMPLLRCAKRNAKPSTGTLPTQGAGTATPKTHQRSSQGGRRNDRTSR